NEQIARFLDEAPFNAVSLTNATLTFSSDVGIRAIALRGYSNARSEFLMTTLPIIDLVSRTSSALVFPQFAIGAGWSTEILLLNPGEATLTGTVFLRTSEAPYTNFDYSIPPRSARSFSVSPLDDPGKLRTGMIRVAPASGSESPEGSLVLALQNGSVTI